MSKPLYELDDLNPGSTYVYRVDTTTGERLPFAAAFSTDSAALLRDLLNAFAGEFEYRGTPGEGEWVRTQVDSGFEPMDPKPGRAPLCRHPSTRWTTYGATCNTPLNDDGSCPNSFNHIGRADHIASRHGHVSQNAHADSPGSVIVQSGGDAVFDGRRQGVRTPITGSPRPGDVNS